MYKSHLSITKSNDFFPLSNSQGTVEVSKLPLFRSYQIFWRKKIKHFHGFGLFSPSPQMGFEAGKYFIQMVQLCIKIKGKFKHPSKCEKRDFELIFENGLF